MAFVKEHMNLAAIEAANCSLVTFLYLMPPEDSSTAILVGFSWAHTC